MSFYAAIFGKNTWMTSGDTDIDKLLKRYHDEGEEISCVAISPSSHAVVCSLGKATVAGPDTFTKKMAEIDNRSDIKQIAFGCKQQWAIVMKNGFCHYSLQPEPMKVVKANQGTISYVSFGNDINDWIIGYGSNGHAPGISVGWELQGFLRALNSSGNTIQLVEIGNNDQWIVQYDNGIECSNHICIPQILKNRLKEPIQPSKPAIKSFSLFGASNALNCVSCTNLRREIQTLKSQLNVSSNNNNSNNKKRKVNAIDDDIDYPPAKKQRISLKQTEEIDTLKTENKRLKQKIESMDGNNMEHIDSFSEKKLNELESTYENKMKLIKEAKERLIENKVKCIACLTNPKNIVIEGCNHFDLCDECESKLEKKICPRCQ
eukprot:447721_1